MCFRFVLLPKICKDDTETIRNPLQPVHAERTGAGLETATARAGQQHQQRATDITLHAQQDGLNTQMRFLYLCIMYI